MADKFVEVIEKSEGVTELVIGPAPSNIVSEAVMAEIIEQLEIVQKNKDKKLVILTGAGDHFSYGASVPEHTPEKVDSMIPNFHKLIDKILSCQVPIMAKVKGNCLGGGFEVVMACHFIYALKDASFAVPEIKLGVFPPPASVLLPFIIGDSLACEMTLTGSAKSGEELKNCGFANAAFDTSEEMDEAIDKFIAKKINPLSASSLRKAVQAVRTGIIERYRDDIQKVEKLYLKDLMSTNDGVEGIVSFIEKRKPEWKNS